MSTPENTMEKLSVDYRPGWTGYLFVTAARRPWLAMFHRHPEGPSSPHVQGRGMTRDEAIAAALTKIDKATAKARRLH